MAFILLQQYFFQLRLSNIFNKMNRSSNKESFYDSRPKFLMQFARQQPVPKLISINQSLSQPFQSISHHNKVDNTLLTQNFSTINSSLPIPRKQMISKQRNYRLEVLNLQKLLQQETQQKIQLQEIIKQLTIKSERLKQINEHLIQRLKEVEKNYISNRAKLEKENQIQLKKQKEQIYSELEQYIKFSVNKLSQTLKSERMNQKIQCKLQQFMEELLQINSHTVQITNQTRRKYRTQQANVLLDTSNLLNKEIQGLSGDKTSKLLFTDERRSSLGPQTSDYNQILNHLDKQRSRLDTSQSFYASNFQINNFRTSMKDKSERKNHLTGQKSMFRHQYSATPHKRKRIFQKD